MRYGFCADAGPRMPLSASFSGMNSLPSACEVRELIRPLDELDRKVLGGLVAVLMVDPQRLRDQEWLAQQFVQVAIVAHGFVDGGDDGEAHASSCDVALVQLYARLRMQPVVMVAMALFVRTAEDLRLMATQPTLSGAQALVRSYLAD
jgi:hypothetical protein